MRPGLALGYRCRPLLLGIAFVALALALVVTPKARAALTRAQADKIALQTLKPQTTRGRVVVFGLPAPLAVGTSVFEAGAGRGVHVKRTPDKGGIGARLAFTETVTPLRGKAWLYWEDYAYDAAFEHPSRLLLIDDATGRVIRSQSMSWYPLIGAQPPAFLRSEAAYHSRQFHIYTGPVVRRTASRLPASSLPTDPLGPTSLPVTPADLKNDCLIVMGDHSDPKKLFVNDLQRMKDWAKTVGLHTDEVGTAEGLDLRIGVLSTLTNPPCKDVFIFIAGHGWPGKPVNDPVTKQPIPTSSLPQVEVGKKLDAKTGKLTEEDEIVTSYDLLQIMRKYQQKVTFKLMVQACFSGRFTEYFKALGPPNLKVVVTSSSSKEVSWGAFGQDYPAVPGSPGNSSYATGVNSTIDSHGSSPFVNGMVNGLGMVVGSQAEATLTGKDLGKIIARAFQLEVGGDFTAQIGWTTPQSHVNPSATVVAMPPPSWTITGLGGVGGSGSSASGISGHRLVIGTATLPGVGTQAIEVKLLKGKISGFLPIKPLPGYSNGLGGGINRSGQAAGTSFNPGGGYHGFFFDNKSVLDLGTLGGTKTLANGVNDSGQVVGTSYLPGDSLFHPFLWQSGKLNDLGTLGGTVGQGLGINNGGSVVGYSALPGNTVFHAFRWTSGKLTDLGTLPGLQNSAANAINSSGQIVGRSGNPTGVDHAFVWTNGTMTDLGLLPGQTSAEATAINDLGWIVGSDSQGGKSSHVPFLYTGGALTNLNSLLPPGSGWNLTGAFGVNLLGEIAGEGVIGGQTQGFVLGPAPQFQLDQLLQVVTQLNATRRPDSRTGAGVFVSIARAAFQRNQTARACKTLDELAQEALKEKAGKLLPQTTFDELTDGAASVAESAGCN